MRIIKLILELLTGSKKENEPVYQNKVETPCRREIFKNKVNKGL